MKKWLWICLILAVLSLLYGLCIAAARSGSPFWMVWIALGACLLGVFALGATGLGGKLPEFVKAGGRLAALLAGLWILCCMILILPRTGSAGAPGLDCILVLGAQVWPSGPSRILQYRLDTAAEYMRMNPETLCIVSGGQGYNEPRPEADVMADYLMQKGIPESRILEEDRSRNTAENIRFCMELKDLTDAEVGIITNDFHLYRSVGIARKQGLGQSVGIAAPSHRFYLPNNLLRECFGMAKDLLQGNMEIWIH